MVGCNVFSFHHVASELNVFENTSYSLQPVDMLCAFTKQVILVQMFCFSKVALPLTSESVLFGSEETSFHITF